MRHRGDFATAVAVTRSGTHGAIGSVIHLERSSPALDPNWLSLSVATPGAPPSSISQLSPGQLVLELASFVDQNTHSQEWRPSHYKEDAFAASP